MSWQNLWNSKSRHIKLCNSGHLMENMRILVLSPYFPWPLYGGNLIRIFGTLKELSLRGHEIHLLAGRSGPAPAPDNPVAVLCKEVEYYRPPASSQRTHALRSGLRALLSPYPYTNSKFGSNEIRRVIRRILARQHFDLIWANFAFMADSVPRNLARDTPVVLDEHESEGRCGANTCAEATWPRAPSDFSTCSRWLGFKKDWSRKSLLSFALPIERRSLRAALSQRKWACGPYPTASMRNLTTPC